MNCKLVEMGVNVLCVCVAGLGIVVILLSCVVTSVTCLSMSAICTNGVVRGGEVIWNT